MSWWAVLRADIEAMCGGGSTLRLLARALIFRRVRAMAYHRVAHALTAHRALLPLAYLLAQRGLASSGADINPLACLGPGMNLVHSAGVVIGPGVVTGPGCWIYQGVTLGTRGGTGQPSLGAGVHVGAGAKILGPVGVGDGAYVGANAVVTHSVPASRIAVGVPAVVRPGYWDRGQRV